MSGKSVPEPNYTQAPNFFFDHIMLEITSTAELKVTLAIIRQTFGYHKAEDQLSLSRLEELTGLSRQSVAEGVKAALSRGYVGRRNAGQSYIYGLRVTSQDSRLPDDSTSQGSRPLTSQDSRPTKESKKESITPTGESSDSSASLTWYEMDTNQRQSYLIAYLHQRLKERDLLEDKPLTPGYKKRLAGELRREVQTGARQARLLFALDRIVYRWPERRLDWHEALNDADHDKVRHLRAVDNHDKPSQEGGGLESLSDKMKRLGVEA